MGNIGLARMEAGDNEELEQFLEHAEQAVERACDLTRQLLTFSKGGAPVKESASVADIIRESTHFALHGSNVRCDLSLAENLYAAEVDSGQINQVLTNLIINADQAMPEGGTINIEACNITVGTTSQLPLPFGKYVAIAIKDSGVGIDEKYVKKIFDPFFTTKQAGNGLGLAGAYSIVKKHGGHIECESTLGRGSVFQVYLPASGRPAPLAISRSDEIIRGTGRVLVMDDEETVRAVAGDILTQIGYEVEFARDGDEAVKLYDERMSRGEPFDIVLVDLTVPGGMGGQAAIKQLQKLDPDVCAIVCSGYSNDPVLADYRSYGFCGRVVKPFKARTLSQAVFAARVGDFTATSAPFI